MVIRVILGLRYVYTPTSSGCNRWNERGLYEVRCNGLNERQFYELSCDGLNHEF
jgi:hypothetical protein